MMQSRLMIGKCRNSHVQHITYSRYMKYNNVLSITQVVQWPVALIFVSVF